MNKIIISTDSTADLSLELKKNITLKPFHFMFDLEMKLIVMVLISRLKDYMN